MTSERLSDTEMRQIEAWPRATSPLAKLAENRMQRAIAEIRERRAADLDADGIETLRVSRDEISRFAFLPEIPRLIKALDQVLAAHGAKR